MTTQIVPGSELDRRRSVATLETETTPQAHRPDTSPSPLEEWEPLHTYNGIKWLPTYQRRSTCEGCPVYDECLADVNRGDFAWCERAIPEDFQLTNPKHTAYCTGMSQTCPLPNNGGPNHGHNHNNATRPSGTDPTRQH